ncbi:hypothetical protein [uncultured Thiothrix sp.]|uniref:COG1470 family protein n=1 Tax=uncultured Thiothrix sp. TaxID=223185 RepID=UPI002633A0C9|nr:hypothetical protein [uncultured Thiothrix sp.]
MSKNQLNNLNRLLLLLVMSFVLIPLQTWALTAANTLIRNQASATFKDEAGTAYSVTSNMVETLVQQVAGLELVQTQTKLASSGATVEFPHVVTNTGNGDDSFSLASAEMTGDSFDFATVKFYADANQDGQADDLSSPITKTPLLKSGESFSFVAIAEVPASLSDATTGKYTLTAASAFTPTTQKTNVDTAEVNSSAVLDVTKSMSATQGTAGSGNYTVTLRYHNSSALDASNVTLIDALPIGMTYVANSARWSESSSTILSDANPSDVQGSVQTITYCAYNSSCTGLPEATQDADTNSTNQVTAIISQVAAGVTGELRFEVKIAANVPASILTNTGEYLFNDGTATTPSFNTNPVKFEVLQDVGVITNGSLYTSNDGDDEPILSNPISQGGTAIFRDYVWNKGNGVDSFDLSFSNSSFPAGTVLHMFQADGNTPLLDTNGNGIPDTGNLDPNTNALIIIKATLPASVNGGTPYSVTLNATSFKDNSVSNPAINTLTYIGSSQVDLTNNTALSTLVVQTRSVSYPTTPQQPTINVPGEGMGPEPEPVTVNNLMPGSKTEFVLYVNNTYINADNYNLQVSTDSSFSTITLPTGWKVRFLDEQAKVITNTGPIPSQGNKRVFAEVTAPANATSSIIHLYFRVLSPTTGASDIKHDAVAVGAITDLVLYPDNTGQILPGGSIVYSHWLSNQGNVDKANISLTTTDEQAGWTSLLYADTDGNGVLSGGDQRLSNLANLAVGDTMLIFAKVLAASDIQMGLANITTVKATWDNGASSVQALDITTTNSSDVSIRKQQALDSNCDGSPETGFTHALFTAEPGQCVVYQLTATNTGAEEVRNVRIQDATPAYTFFNTAGGLPQMSQGSLAHAINQGSTGDITGVVGTLAAGNNASLTFAIKIQ